MTADVQAAEQLTLTDEESRLLQLGLIEWCGPARSTEEFAVAMGFDGREDLHHGSLRIRAALIAHEALEPMDWARALLATELAFASDVSARATSGPPRPAGPTRRPSVSYGPPS
ncbi:hypothetical protein ACFWUT_20580 [Streptomyces cyaneofuscatus]|uniref:hypothetical protein n=1 Tax=Streptomyces cyaneofuscatus TaxID=66883 RepID=UPI003655287F